MARLHLAHAEVHEGAAEATGPPDAVADRVVINGLLNLARYKAAVLREVARILRPAGHLPLAESTLRAPLPEGSGSSLEDWFR